MTYVTCRLTAKNRDQLWNPTLGNRVWATFTFFTRQIFPVLHNGPGDVPKTTTSLGRIRAPTQVCPQSALLSVQPILQGS